MSKISKIIFRMTNHAILKSKAMKNIFNPENYRTGQVLLIIVMIILITPVLFTISAFSEYFDFSSTGEIGDTIGGITTPFISGFAAFLVFIAFKAQIRANEIFRNQEKSRIILDQISLIQNDKLEIEKIVASLSHRAKALEFQEQYTDGHLNMIDKVLFFITEYYLTLDLLNEYMGEKEFLYSKLFFLYVIRYRTQLNKMATNLDKSKPYHKSYSDHIDELVRGINKMDRITEDFETFMNYKRK